MSDFTPLTIEKNLEAKRNLKKKESQMIDVNDPTISADFSQVPDSVPMMPIGVYDFIIDEVVKQLPKPKEDGKISDGYNVVLTLHVDMPESPHNGRKTTKYLWVSTDKSQTPEQKKFNLMDLKRLDKACGFNPEATGSMNVQLWKGRKVRGEVRSEVYKGRQVSSIAKFFIPGDAELAPKI